MTCLRCGLETEEKSEMCILCSEELTLQPYLESTSIIGQSLINRLGSQACLLLDTDPFSDTGISFEDSEDVIDTIERIEVADLDKDGLKALSNQWKDLIRKQRTVRVPWYRSSARGTRSHS